MESSTFFSYLQDNIWNENNIEYDSTVADNWNLEEKSINHAHETGHWYVTGTCKIYGPADIKLQFEFEFCEGYIDGIIGTPYNEDEQDNHGIVFY